LSQILNLYLFITNKNVKLFYSAKPTKDEGGGGLRRSISLSNLTGPNKPVEKNPDKHHLAPDYGPLMDKLSHCTSYEVLYQVCDWETVTRQITLT